MFEWDQAKNEENLRKHGISFEEASLIWKSPVLTSADDRFHYGENRSLTLGMLYSLTVVLVAHTDRDGKVRLISARRATKTERTRYERYLRETLG